MSGFVHVNLSMSLDGYVTGRDPTPQNPLGDAADIIRPGGELWMVDETMDAAGDKNVYLMGGAATVNQAVRAGLVDEVVVHVEPVLLGGGPDSSTTSATRRSASSGPGLSRARRARTSGSVSVTVDSLRSDHARHRRGEPATHTPRGTSDMGDKVVMSQTSTPTRWPQDRGTAASAYRRGGLHHEHGGAR